MNLRLLLFTTILALCGCQSKDDQTNSLDKLKHTFLTKICEAEVEEAPFDFTYELRTVLFSKDLVSLFGIFHEYTNLPHGHARYEGKTFCRIKGRFEEIAFAELFSTADQKEFLRNYCERELKKEGTSYFSHEDHWKKSLELEDIHTFVIDHRNLIIIFQPYVVGGYADGPFVVKIPFDQLNGHWNATSRLSSMLSQVIASKAFVSCWNEDHDKMDQQPPVGCTEKPYN